MAGDRDERTDGAPTGDAPRAGEGASGDGWAPEVEGIAERRRRAAALGGPGAVERQHAKGRLTVRERIERLVDAGSFREQGPIAGSAETDDAGRLVDFSPANYVLGLATVEGRPCAVGGEDFTQKGGSPSPAGLRKSVYAETLALRYRVPLLRLLEGGGGSVASARGRGARATGEPVYAPPRFRSIMEVMGAVPVASAAMGAVAGFPAARLAASHFAVMVRGTSQAMAGGPPLVERALGRRVDKEELGGAALHARSGLADRVAEDEDEALALLRAFLGYLPTNVWELPPRGPREDDPARADEALLDIVPRDRRKVYDARRLVRGVLDAGSFFELGAGFGRSQIAGLARLDGRPVGVLANDPRFYGGAMTADGAQKVRRMVDLFDTFHLPVVSFVDEPGFMIGPEAERAGTLRHGAAALFAVQQSAVPWCSVLVRKAFGVAAAAHFGPEGTVLAWPSAETGALPVEGGVAVAFRREIERAADPAARRRELEEELARGRSPFPRAESFSVHDLIDPRETRAALCEWLCWSTRLLPHQLGPRRHGVRP